MHDKIAETICNICAYIDADVKRAQENEVFIYNETIELTKALAQLVEAFNS